jgi:hypothetical protein
MFRIRKARLRNKMYKTFLDARRDGKIEFPKLKYMCDDDINDK